MVEASLRQSNQLDDLGFEITIVTFFWRVDFMLLIPLTTGPTF
jgi:hypothetical protein